MDLNLFKVVRSYREKLQIRGSYPIRTGRSNSPDKIWSGMVVPEPLGVFLPLLNNGSWGLGTPGPAQYSALLPVGQKDFVRSYWKLIHWGAGVGPFSCHREVGAWRVGL